ncbi:hypothetical protein MTP99_002338 [Tenebrio molitor]|nr:hypothetical protein MTP99_002338 [Tenebrio molitor]
MTDDDETELSPSNPTNANSDSTGKSKKIRSSDSVESLTSTSELLMLAKDAVNSEQYPMDFDQMVEFMEKVSGETDILALVRSFTNDTQGVINLLHDVYNVVPHKSIKNRCRKIQRRIRKALLSKDSVSADDLNLSTIVGEPIAYTNIASLLAKYDDFCAFVGRDEPSIILLTETWLSSSIPDSLVSIRGYTLFRRDRFGRRGGGVCMYFANRVLTNFKIQPISGDFRGIEALFLGVHSKTVSFVLGCVYRPPSSSISDDKILMDFIKGLADTSQKIFIFGDFNMPDLLWPLDSSGPFSNSSQLMADLIINSHLCQLVSEPTRFRLNQTPSTLDLIISSDDNSLTNLKHLSPIGISDHVTLGIELQIYSCPRLKTVSFERTVVEWAAVNQHLSVVDWNLLLSNTSMTHNWKVFKTTLQDTIAQHTTRARTRYEASIANSKDTKHFHKHIRTQLSGPVGTPQVRDITGSVTDNSDVVADIFADVFSKVFTKESRDRIPAVPGPPNSTFLSDIDFLETVVCEKIRKLKVSKSPGPDLITAKTYVRPVLEFANCVWTPVLQRDIQLLESVQRRATRVPFGRSRPQYTARLSLMGIPSLSARRVRGICLLCTRGVAHVDTL